MTRRNRDTNESNWTLHWPELALLLWLLLAALAGSAAAQSTDPKSPTPLTAGEISGGEIEERASYYFTFEAGPGEVTAALEAKMQKGAKGASVGVELFDADAKSLASALISGGLDAGREKLESALFKQLGKLTAAADSLGGGDTKQKTARVKVKTRQPLVLKLSVDKGVESFTLRVGGAVEFAQAADAPAVVTPADTLMPADTAGAEGETQPVEPTEQSPPGEQTQPASDPNTAGASPTQDASQPTSGRPAVLLPGRRPALIKVPTKRAQPGLTQPAQKPALVKVPGKQSQAPSQQQQQQQPGAKPPAVRIPGKKQP